VGITWKEKVDERYVIVREITTAVRFSCCVGHPEILLWLCAATSTACLPAA
jgi:hypothetical protein